MSDSKLNFYIWDLYKIVQKFKLQNLWNTTKLRPAVRSYGMNILLPN